jgi:hypothetical protein
MTHRLECGGDDCEPTCACRCHERCLRRARPWRNAVSAGTYISDPCWRLSGHRGSHRSRWAVEYDRTRAR